MSTVWGEGHVKVDLDLVPEPEGAKKCRVGPDSPSALDDTRPTTRPSVTPPWIVTGRVMPMIVSSPSRVNEPADPSTRLDRKVMVGCWAVWRTCLRVLLICAVGVGERLDAAGSLPDLEGTDVDLDVHRGVRRDGGVDPGVTMPAGDLDGEIVAGLGAQPCPGRVDQEPAGLRPSL